MRDIRRRLLTAAGLALAAAMPAPAALAGGDHEGGHGHDDERREREERHGHDDGHAHGDGHAFGFGEAAPDAAPDRTVEVTARDSMRFEPDRIVVEPGQIVRFVVENVGKLQHSFTLGTPQYQRTHDEQMRGMAPDELAGHMKGSSNGMVIPPGGTGSLTWRFERDGPVEFACHIPGHYPAGMKGRVRIE